MLDIMFFSSGYQLAAFFGWSAFSYRKVLSSNTSHLEAHAGFFRLLMKRIFDPYVLCTANVFPIESAGNPRVTKCTL